MRKCTREFDRDDTGPARGREKRPGVILFAVLVVVAVMTLVAYRYSDFVTSEYAATESYSRVGQARALAESGVHYAAAILGTSDNFTKTLNGNPWDNPSV